MSSYQDRLTANANDFDSIVTDMLKDLERKTLLLVDSYKEIERQAIEISILKRSKFSRFNNDECWIYDGQDDKLDSLVCPVVISASDLRKIINNNKGHNNE